MRAGGRIALTVIVMATALVGCASHHSKDPKATSTTTTVTHGTTTTTVPVKPKPKYVSTTIWLCHPHSHFDPCISDESATGISGSGARTAQPAPPTSPSANRVDCFYVYPTVSGQPTANSDFRAQRPEKLIATQEMSRFSQLCRIWAPMYEQRTVADLAKNGVNGNFSASLIAYATVLDAWKDYIGHFNAGHPFVLIGDGQGAAILIHLIATEIDPNPKLRAQMISAILLGANVEVPPGRLDGGSFQNVPACVALGQAHCVISYSAFDRPPPPDAELARPGQGMSLAAGPLPPGSQEVLCTNPADLSGVTAPLTPYFVSFNGKSKDPIPTPWVSYPGLYSAHCEQADGAGWLQVDASHPRTDVRPLVHPLARLGKQWGLAADDFTIALGNLVVDLAVQERDYRR